jgi:hypothetical protein
MSMSTISTISTISKLYRVKVYVGPVHVEHYASQATKAGLAHVWTGTEHVYATILAPALPTETDRLCFRQTVAEQVYGCPLAAGWRDVEILGTD